MGQPARCRVRQPRVASDRRRTRLNWVRDCLRRAVGLVPCAPTRVVRDAWSDVGGDYDRARRCLLLAGRVSAPAPRSLAVRSVAGCAHDWHYYGDVNGVPYWGCQTCGAESYRDS